MRPKLIYLARRHPDLDPEAFREKWRAHGRLGMSLPRWRNVLRYAQCDALPGSGGLAGACDGVATLVFRSEASRLAHVADPSGAATRADEASTFAAPVRECSVLTGETVLLPHRGGGIRLFLLATWDDRGAAGEFRERWLEHGRSFAQDLQACDPGAGYSQNHARPDSLALGLGLAVDCIDEVSLGAPERVPAVLDLLDGGRSGRLGAAAICWLATRETLLFDGGLSGGEAQP